jgi:hypothetical protein
LSAANAVGARYRGAGGKDWSGVVVETIGADVAADDCGFRLIGSQFERACGFRQPVLTASAITSPRPPPTRLRLHIVPPNPPAATGGPPNPVSCSRTGCGFSPRTRR